MFRNAVLGCGGFGAMQAKAAVIHLCRQTQNGPACLVGFENGRRLRGQEVAENV